MDLFLHKKGIFCYNRTRSNLDHSRIEVNLLYKKEVINELLWNDERISELIKNGICDCRNNQVTAVAKEDQKETLAW